MYSVWYVSSYVHNYTHTCSFPFLNVYFAPQTTVQQDKNAGQSVHRITITLLTIPQSKMQSCSILFVDLNCPLFLWTLPGNTSFNSTQHDYFISFSSSWRTPWWSKFWWRCWLCPCIFQWTCEEKNIITIKALDRYEPMNAKISLVDVSPR